MEAQLKSQKTPFAQEQSLQTAQKIAKFIMKELCFSSNFPFFAA
jgi:hypothetical protein